MYQLIIKGNRHMLFKSATEACTYALSYLPIGVDWDWEPVKSC